jgi:putative addiction module component (TIGR02574 family)
MSTLEIASLSLQERLQLLDELWESLSRTPEMIPLTAAQREEIERRLDEINRDGPVGIPWDEVLRQISPAVKSSVPTTYTTICI